MRFENGVACCIADDGCSRSPCSHASEEAVSRCMGVEHVALLVASLMMVAALLRALTLVRR
eukprot:5269903-Prymnesium_polylepis.1